MLACSSKVERALSEVPGVLRADVSVATHRARVVLAPEGEKADCVAAVKKCGFRCSLATRDESPAAASQREVAGWWRSLKVALLLSIPIFVAKWGGMIGPGQDFWHTGIGCHGMFTIEALVACLRVVCKSSSEVGSTGTPTRNSRVVAGAWTPLWS